MMIAVIGLFIMAAFFVTSSGHEEAIAASEAALRARYDARGAEGEASRKLMREAGYNV